MTRIYKRNKKFMILFFFLVTISVALSLNYINKNNVEINNNPRINQSDIIINTPENITYSEPMSGYYPASYGFENDENGENPYGIDVSSEEYENIEIQVIDGIDNHYKVVEVDDQNNTDGWPGVYLTSIFPVSFGTLEYWIRFESLTDGLGIDARDSLNNLCLSFFI